jgi:uncharacterized protein YecE (DUF72 family)
VARRKYYDSFDLVEIQSTFYKLPRESTAMRWRDQAPSHFEFAVKAWQAITHPTTSPTWRRTGLEIPKSKRAGYGHLTPSRENFEAWTRTLEICDILRARICLIQCPPSFRPNPVNTRNLTRFLTEIDRHGMIIAWEPRGDWLDKPQLIRAPCKKLNLIHVVDPLRRMPAAATNLAYLRLHGLGPRETNYSYRYSETDLRQLLTAIDRRERAGCEECYVLFNNISMFDDAQKFIRIARSELRE